MPGESVFENMPVSVLERIAFYLIAYGLEENFLGPPSAIIPLLLSSSSINQKLSYKVNSHLYARIFRYKFDDVAIGRRLSPRWFTTRCLTDELRKRCCALKRIKGTEFDVQDLWTIYLMLLEDDGRNSAQLLTYAGVRDYIRAIIMSRIDSQAEDIGWLKQPILDSLILWIFWIISNRETIIQEPSHLRQCLAAIANGFVISGFRHSSVYAPDLFFSLPSGVEDNIIRNFVVTTDEIIHYSHRLHVITPMIAPVAILVATVLAESNQSASPLSYHHSLPLNRDDANARGIQGHTLTDLEDFHYHNRIYMANTYPPVNNSLFDLDDVSVEDTGGGALDFTGGDRSGSHDLDWYRLVGCHDPRDGSHPLRGTVYKLGCLAGSWSGRILIPDAELQMALAMNRGPLNYPTASVGHAPLHWELKEHHCLDPESPISPGSDAFLDSDDILNAWLPRGVTFTHSDDAVDVYDPATGNTVRYTTVISGDASLYRNAKTPRLRGESDDTVIAATLLDSEPRSTYPSYIDNDEEYEDTVSHISSGVSDILITGKTGNVHGDAWGHYTLYGRVRPWDGLVALVRFPRNPTDDHSGRWIFKGYMHGNNFVGRWRETAAASDQVGYQGGFVVYKR